MTLRLTLVALALLSQTGCVAALPLAVQLVSGASSAQLLSQHSLRHERLRARTIDRSVRGSVDGEVRGPGQSRGSGCLVRAKRHANAVFCNRRRPIALMIPSDRS